MRRTVDTWEPRDQRKLSFTRTFTGHRPLTRYHGGPPRISSAATMLSLALVLGGCTDTRISVQDLQERQEQIASAESVPVKPQDLGLVELRPYAITPGDILNVSLNGLPASTAPGGTTMNAAAMRIRVHDDGMISLPMVGDVKVGNLSLAAAERAVTDAYVPSFVKTLSVFIELSGSDEPTTVLVRGAAGTPGLVTLKNNQRNIMYALSAAGAFGPGASGRIRLRPIRPDQDEVVYNLADANDVRRALLHPPLQSGDMLTVEAEPISAVYVIGLVNAQGPIPVPVGSQLSIMRAIAHAGGLRDLLSPKEATLWRTLPNGENVRVKLSIADILAGKAPDLALQSGDILDVPHTIETRAIEWAMNNIKLGPFGVGAFYDPITVATFQDSNDSDKVGWGRTIGNAVIYNAVGGALNPAVQKTAP